MYIFKQVFLRKNPVIEMVKTPHKVFKLGHFCVADQLYIYIGTVHIIWIFDNFI